MILQALNDYYDRLNGDPEVTLPQFGFSRQKIAFEVVLDPKGTLLDIADLRDTSQKTPVPRSLIVPGAAKPSGSGLHPGLLWDNTGYMLGIKPDDPNPDRTQASFAAFRDRHVALDAAIGDPEFSAVCQFLQHWDPAVSDQYPVLAELTAGGFGVFRIGRQHRYVHDSDRVQAWHLTQLQQADTATTTPAQCLVTGQTVPIARLHEPKVKGVRGAQSSGAAIVSFNFNASESYGRSQGDNAPVSTTAAFQYSTALNHLLAGTQRLQIGDATTVFWTDRPAPGEQTVLPMVFETTLAADDEERKTVLRSVLQRIVRGEYPAELGDAGTRFFMLGLSPNAGRLSIRFWWVSSLGDLVQRLRAHFTDLAIAPQFESDPEFPALWQLLRETARESKDVHPLLAGALMRAVLHGTPYPQTLYTAVLRRIRADRQINRVRAGILKAWLNRQDRAGHYSLSSEVPMSLDADRPDPAYQMGRLFAVLEKTQEDALPHINATIKDRYFGAASATPGNVFPRLIRLSQHHLGRLERPSRIYHERQIQEITAHLDTFATHLNLQDQGLFALGYYHQRKALFTKRTPDSSSTPTDAAAEE